MSCEALTGRRPVMLFALTLLVIGFGMVAIVINLPHTPGMVTAPAEDWFALSMRSIIKTAAASEPTPVGYDQEGPVCGNPSCPGSCEVCQDAHEDVERDPEKLMYLQEERDQRIFTATSLCHGYGDVAMCAQDCTLSACRYHPQVAGK
jgi:hypothetical protein